MDGDGSNDSIIDRTQYTVTQTLQLVGIGSTASAITSIVNGGVRFVTITNRGSGYKSSPRVAFSSAPFGGTTAIGIATMIDGIVDLCEPNNSLLRVQGVQLTNPGYGYTIAPKISFTGGVGAGAEAFATIGDGVIGVISITNAGSGYITPPTVSFVGASTQSAQATSVINGSGSVTQIRLTNAGLGYTQNPQILISPPNIMVGFGTYQFNEVVVGSISSITARVKSWNSITKILEVSNSTGTFVPGEVVTGRISGANYSIRSRNLDTSSSGFGQNDNFQEEANKILDFSEENPFGTP